MTMTARREGVEVLPGAEPLLTLYMTVVPAVLVADSPKSWQLYCTDKMQTIIIRRFLLDGNGRSRCRLHSCDLDFNLLTFNVFARNVINACVDFDFSTVISSLH